MRRSVAFLALVVLQGCGSCLDDKKVPASSASSIESVPEPTVVVTTEAGMRIMLTENEGFAGFADVISRAEAGADDATVGK